MGKRLTQLYLVKEILSGGKERLLSGIPTPRLIQAGSGQAWMQHSGIWRLKEDTDPSGARYKNVRIVMNLDR